MILKYERYIEIPEDKYELGLPYLRVGEGPPYDFMGVEHRAGGPALTLTDVSTGMIVEENYTKKGVAHRDPKDGPAQIWRDRHTGIVVAEVYQVEGECHRDPKDGPAYIERDPKTGEIVRSWYYVNGERISHSNEKDLRNRAERTEPARRRLNAGEPSPR